MGPGFGEAVGAAVVRAILIGALVVLATGAGCGFLIARLVK